MKTARLLLLLLLGTIYPTVAIIAPVVTISNISDQTISEDGATGAISFTISGLQGRSQTLTGSSSNTKLITTSGIVFSGTGSSRTVTVTPEANQSGTSTITITVVDIAGTDTETFNVTVTPVNDFPTVTSIGSQSINEDETLGPLSFTVDDVETPAANLTVTTSTSNPTLIPAGNISIGGSGNARTITLTPAANLSGSSTIGIFVSDGSLTGSTRFTVTVNPVNDPPSISDIPDQAINENGSLGPIAFGVSDPETAVTNLKVTGQSSNQALVPDGNITIALGGAIAPVWTIKVTPVAGQSGTATITVAVTDGSLTASDTFLLTVNAIDDPPTISSIPFIATNEDTTSAPASFTVGDPDTPLDKLTLSADSSVPSLIPVSGISFGGSGANRTVTVTPAGDQSGAATITVTVSDGTSNASTQFRVSVAAVNDPPTISDIPNQSINESSSTGAIGFTVGDVEFGPANLTLQGSSSNASLVSDNGISFGGSGANRTVTVTPVAGQSGTATITVTVSDGALTATDTFVVTVNAVDDPPTISSIATITTNEDATSAPSGFTVGDPDTPLDKLTLSADSSVPSLIPVSGISFGGSGANRTVTVTPAGDQSGTATITVTVSDGTATASTQFRVSVAAVNDPPTISDIPNQSISESSSTGAIPLTVGDVDSGPANLTLQGSSSNASLVSDNGISFGGSGANRTVTVTPVAGQSGTATITVTVSDGALTATDTFVVTVNAVDDPPTISSIATITTNEDTTSAPSGFTVGDPDTPLDKLTLTADSSVPSLIPVSGISFGGSGANRTVTVTPAGDQSGAATITVTVSDGSATASTQFRVSVAAVNDPPTITDIPNQTISENANTGALAFTVGDVETAAANLTVQASSSNQTLVPNGSVALGGSGANRTVTVTPAAGQSGSATITVTVSDGAATATDTFVVTVTSVNHPPTISNIADQTINEDANTGPVAFTIGDSDSGAANLNLEGGSSNTSLVPNAGIAFGGSGANRTVTVIPVANQSGTATITVTVSDGSLTSSDTFLLTVNAANDPPTISSIPSITTNEDTSSAPASFTIGDLDTPPANLTLTADSSAPSLIPVSGITLGGSGASRTLTVTPAPNQSGTATITVTVSDGSATASTQTRVSVSAVNDPPTISNIPDQSVAGGSSTGAIAFSVDDPDGAANLTLLASSSNTSLVPTSAISFGGTGNNRTVAVTPVGNQGGSSTITVTVSDGLLTASDAFVLTVSSVVEAPKILSPPQNATVKEGDNAVFTVTATGTSPLSYQWLFNGQSIPEATGPSYSIFRAQAAQAGSYSVKVSNAAGSVTSTAAALVVQRFDFGDAPESSLAVLYHTKLASKGPRHLIAPGFFLGKSVDAEPDGQPSSDALGDDSTPSTVDDEDGVQFTSPFTPGKQATMTVTASTQGILDAWFDFNRASGFEAAEHLINKVVLVPGPNTLTVNVPANAAVGDTFARFRLSRTGLDTPDDVASTAPVPEGEVEDYKLSVTAETVQLDFGDAPDVAPGAVGGLGYPTLLVNNGARHVIVPGFFLGKSVDAETDGQPNAAATGDDLKPENLDDEDGVEFLTPLVPGQSAKVAVTASQAGHLDAWIDFNRDKSWGDQGEQIFLSATLAAGLNTLSFAVPASAQGGPTYARFRFSKNGKLGFTGQAPDGEVEDYQVTIDAGAPCDVNYKGTDFWLAFPGNYPASATAPLKLTFCIRGTPGTTGVVAAGGVRFNTSFTVPVSGAVTITLPDAASLGDVVDVVQNKGIHVTSSAPVAVYGLNRIPYSADGYLGLPVGALGTEYIVSGYPNVFSEVSALNGTQFAIVASQDETSVLIVPAHTVLGHPAGDPFTVLLNKGQTYQLRDPNDATADLSGTEILSDKPVAVFGGHQCADINSPSKLFCDHLVEQLLPTTAFGKVFYTVPLLTRTGGDTFRVVAAQDDTKLFVNGVQNATLNRGQIRTLTLSTAARLNADKPVHVAQFANSSDFDGVQKADPFMVTVPPTRFYTKDHSICTGPADFPNHYVNVVAPSSVAGTLTLDGVAVPAGSFSPIGVTGFSFARLPVLSGPHQLTATQPFATIVYGFGQYESYAWPGGMYFGDITPPTIVCPPDFTVSLGGIISTTGALSCKAAVPDLRQKTQVTDNCPLPAERVLTQAPAPGSLLEVGVHPITLTARDASENESSCVVMMTVVDPGVVSLVCPKDMKVRCNKGTGASVAYQVVAQTPCGTQADVDCIPASGSFFPLGTTAVKCAVKGSPNLACGFNVTVECPLPGSNLVAVPRRLSFSWAGEAILETSFGLDGPWTPVPAATPPFAPAQPEIQQFFRLVQPSISGVRKASLSAPELILE